MITELDIKEAGRLLREAKKSHHEACKEFTDIKSIFEQRKAEGLSSGEIEGKNAELREASARKFLSNIYDEMERSQANQAEARLNLELATIAWEAIDRLLRLAEVTK